MRFIIDVENESGGVGVWVRSRLGDDILSETQVIATVEVENYRGDALKELATRMFHTQLDRQREAQATIPR